MIQSGQSILPNPFVDKIARWEFQIAVKNTLVPVPTGSPFVRSILYHLSGISTYQQCIFRTNLYVFYQL